MQLALALGMPADRLEREMTHRELRQWTQYVRSHLLPPRRAEIMLAQVCMLIAKLGGNDTATIDDYLIDFGPEPEAPEPDLEATKVAFAFSPRKKKGAAT